MLSYHRYVEIHNYLTRSYKTPHWEFDRLISFTKTASGNEKDNYLGLIKKLLSNLFPQPESLEEWLQYALSEEQVRHFKEKRFCTSRTFIKR